MTRVLRSLTSKRRKGKEPQVRIEKPQQEPQTQNNNSNEPLPLPPLKFNNPSHKPIYANIKKRLLRPSRHYCREDMIKLGINEDLWMLFENLRIGTFVNTNFRTYVEPTREFLSSFEATPIGDTIDTYFWPPVPTGSAMMLQKLVLHAKSKLKCLWTLKCIMK